MICKLQWRVCLCQVSIYLVRQAKEHGQAVDPESEEHKNVVQTIFAHEVRLHNAAFIRCS